MKLYHGTNIEFGCIELEKCPPDRDFGQGFYLTNIHAHAQERAEDKVDWEGGVATVMEFDFDFDEIIAEYPSLRIKRFENVSKEWAHFVMQNRLRKEDDPKHEYDIVEGPIANDKMFRQFRQFLNNKIKTEELIRSLTFREATHQIAFCTEKALDALLEYNKEPRYWIETLVSKLTVALLKDNHVTTVVDALCVIYYSDMFTQLEDYTTKLYRKPWPEMYELLKKELKK